MKLKIDERGVYAFQLLLDVPLKPEESEKRLVFFSIHKLIDGKVLENYDLYQVKWNKIINNEILNKLFKISLLLL